jgi:predicted small metal-binding protein
MPLFSSIQYNGLTLYFSFHIGGDDAEFIIDEVSVGASTTNILDVLSEDVINKIEKFIGENLDKIIKGNR